MPGASEVSGFGSLAGVVHFLWFGGGGCLFSGPGVVRLAGDG